MLKRTTNDGYILLLQLQ